jgi:flagellar biosynthesis/type III secretory pathway protein FliH
MKHSAVLPVAECQMPDEAVPARAEPGDRKSAVVCHVLEPLHSPFDCSSDSEGGEETRREGYRKGLEDGLRQAEQGKTFQAANALASAFEQLRAEFSPAAEQRRRAEILELSLAIARRVVMGEMKTNPGAVGQIVSALLTEAESRKVFAVRLHPDDLERIKQSPGAVERLEKAKIALQSSPEIRPGGVILETGFGKLDARLETRLDEMTAALLGQPESGSPTADADAADRSTAGNRPLDVARGPEPVEGKTETAS